jgi:hypothetical protein
MAPLRRGGHVQNLIHIDFAGFKVGHGTTGTACPQPSAEERRRLSAPRANDAMAGFFIDNF